MWSRNQDWWDLFFEKTTWQFYPLFIRQLLAFFAFPIGTPNRVQSRKLCSDCKAESIQLSHDFVWVWYVTIWPCVLFFAHLLVIFKLLMITRRIMRGFICTFSLSISLSITLWTSEFRNQFTICSTYLDMARYLDQTTTKMTECYRYLAVNKARRELTRSKFGWTRKLTI